MADLFNLLKKTNPNLDITFDPKTNTVKVNNSEKRIKELQKIKELERVTKEVQRQKELEIRRELEVQRLKEIKRQRELEAKRQKELEVQRQKELENFRKFLKLRIKERNTEIQYISNLKKTQDVNGIEKSIKKQYITKKILIKHSPIKKVNKPQIIQPTSISHYNPVIRPQYRRAGTGRWSGRIR